MTTPDPYNTARLHLLSVLASPVDQDRAIVFMPDDAPEVPAGCYAIVRVDVIAFTQADEYQVEPASDV